MELQKIGIKFFALEHQPVPLTAFIDLFHGWIQASDGVYHDVADYSHMHRGPGIVLVAQDANLSIDETGGRRGFLFQQKAPLAGSNQERLDHVFRGALESCRRLQAEPALQKKLEFRFDEFEIMFNDRLAAPHTEDSHRALEAELGPFVARLFGGARVAIAQEGDVRKLVRLRVQAMTPIDAGALLENLRSASSAHRVN